MGFSTLLPLGVLLCSLQLVSIASAHFLELNITVPRDYKVQGTDAYVCTVTELPSKPTKLVGVVPLAEQNVVHHILLFGCTMPAHMPKAGGEAWECMHHSVCDGPQEIIYGWGRNAPHLELPPGVAFSVGPGTTIRYIVAQVHFLGQRPPNDDSGVTLLMKPHPTPYAAGLIAFASSFSIPPRTKSTKVDNTCCYQGHQPLTTFAFRVHTHSLGRSVYMTRALWNHTGRETVAVNNPQLPQAFYPVKQQLIWPGDRLTVTCDFDSTSRDTFTNSGGTHDDEMCNMYMMVYAPHPFITMCAGVMLFNEETPGMLPRTASFMSDPSPFWHPPDPTRGRRTTLLAPAQGAGTDAQAAQQAARTEGARLGDVTGVAMGGDGSLWGLYRGSRHWEMSTFLPNNKMAQATPIPEAVLVQLNPDTGEVIRSLGPNTFGMPHMVTVDREGNLWVADVGRHQILKFSSNGTLVMSVGTAWQPQSGDHGFCMPTKVAVARDGTFYVSDGYCNSRVLKFSPDGKLLAKAEVPRTNGMSPVVHHVLLDECANMIYVAAREVGIIYSFDINTMALKMTYDKKKYGKVWSLAMGPYGVPLALMWNPAQTDEAHLINLLFEDQHWVLPGLKDKWPHDVALGAAPVVLSGAADRMFALYVASVCMPPGCGPLRRLILAPSGYKVPPASQLVLPAGSSLETGEEVAERAAESGKGAEAAVKEAAAAATEAWAKAKDINTTGTGLAVRDPDVAAKLAAAIEAAKKEAEERLKKGGSKDVGVDGEKEAAKQGDPGQAAGVMIADDAADIETEVEGGDEEKAEDYEAKHGGGDRADSPEEAAQKDAEEEVHGNPDDVDSNEEFAVVVTREDPGGLGTGDGARTPLWQVIAVVVFAVTMAAAVGVFAFNLVRKFYTREPYHDSSANGGGRQPGAGVKYHQASIDELLAESAKLEGIEEGGSALSTSTRNGKHANGLGANGSAGQPATIALTPTGPRVVRLGGGNSKARQENGSMAASNGQQRRVSAGGGPSGADSAADQGNSEAQPLLNSSASRQALNKAA